MRTNSIIVSAGLAALAAAQRGPPGGPTPAMACASLTAPAVPGASVVSITAMEMTNMNVMMANGTMVAMEPFCDVNVTLTHGTAGDNVRIEVWMPLSGWNMRFQGTGGGGFVAGTFGAAMAPQVALGYAAASTDAGLTPSANGSATPFNRQLLINFASLSVHEMAVVGKAVVNQFYGMPARFTYWNGCSTGGRQGMMEAQTYPEDFNGILAIAPAINWAKFVPASLFPYAIMNQANEFVPACVFNAFQQATIDACDELDGAKDGVITQPGACRFNVTSMVGQAISCTANNNGRGGGGMTGMAGMNATSVMITEAQAAIYNQILDGARGPTGERIWYGLLPGTSMTTLAGNAPFSLGATWVEDFVLSSTLNSNMNMSMGNMSSAEMVQALDVETLSEVIDMSQDSFDIIIGTDNPNLMPFQRAGGKLLTWHGLSDQLIFPNGTFDYRQRVEDMMGNAASVDSFYRVFGAPGIMHCGGGPGAMPVDPLNVLVDWVERGRAPDTLPAMRGATARTANGTQAPAMLTRNLCRYPQVIQYRGRGDPNNAQSWGCAAGPNQGVIEERTQSQNAVVIATAAAADMRGSILAVLVPVALLAVLFL